MKDNKKHIYLFCLATSLFWFSLYAYIPELSTYGVELGATYKMAGLIAGSYGFTQMLLRIPLGILSDHLNNRKLFISMGMVVSIISGLVTFIIPSVSSLLITRLLAGVSATTWVAFTILFSSYYKKNESPKAVGILNAFNAIGQVIAMILGGFISINFGTRYLFLLSTMGAILGLLCSLGIKETVTEKKGFTVKRAKQVFSDHRLLFVAFLAILSQFITFATLFGFTPVIAKNIGATGLQLSALTILGVAPAIFISPIAGTTLVEKWGATKTVFIGFAISTIITLLLPITKELMYIYVIQIFSGVGRSLVFPVLMGLSIKHVANEERATAMGVFQSLYGIGMVVGPMILGTIGDSFGLIIGFIFTAGIGVFAMLSLFAGRRIML